jgi:hypothetical protein
MPVVIKSQPKPAPAAPAAPPAASQGLTPQDVQDMLDARDAAWSRQLQTIAEAFGMALKAVQPTKAPVLGWDFKMDYIPGSYALKSIRALPITKTPKE